MEIRMKKEELNPDTDAAIDNIENAGLGICVYISSRLMEGSNSRNQGTGTQPFRAECRFLCASSQKPPLIYYYYYIFGRVPF